MFTRWIILGFVGIILPCLTVQSTQHQLSTQATQDAVEGRFAFPIEISIPDMINGFLAAFRFLWGRVQNLFGFGDPSEIVGAKDPPKPGQHLSAPLTPSPALQALPLAPEDELKAPVQLVSVEVDDPVRHPSMHKNNVKGKRKRIKKKKHSFGSLWELVAMEAGWF
ncbi:uncharacterized protein LOC129770112 [Toxorhynchites rutilus septentrionalis]|uniref:uncharacterized protein LOC129770112 n=1 Tax=Toxorhynchites rutilus septentrionalis TaxID=329112 RepID=UPI002478AAFD|nr:uncharacterized protein LOC129770112 [Toxorhynchites rutilus septentrionalis]